MSEQPKQQQSSPMYKDERAVPTLASVELTAADHEAMEGMSEAAKKIYIMRRRVKVYREGSLFKRRSLASPQKDKEYLWINMKEERRIFFEGMGWQVCQNPNVGSNYWKQDKQAHICADLILYEMPKELHQMIEADNIVRGLDLTDPKAAASAFADAMRQQGVRVPVFEPKVA